VVAGEGDLVGGIGHTQREREIGLHAGNVQGLP
jgi:hypothetical protein